MIKINSFWVPIVALILSACASGDDKAGTEQSDYIQYEGSWKSLKQHETPVDHIFQL